MKLMLFWKSLWKIQLPFSKITKGKGKYINNPEMNIYSRSGIVKFYFFNNELIQCSLMILISSRAIIYI